MISFTMPVLIKALYPAFIIILGLILARAVERVEDTSLSACCLFIFAPVLLFRQALEIQVRDRDFVLILVFLLLQLILTLGVVLTLLRWLNLPQRSRHLYLVNILLISTFTIYGLQPFIGDPLKAGKYMNLLLFLHLFIIASVGVYLSADNPRFRSNLLSVFKTPLVYAIVAGLAFSWIRFRFTYEILTIIDSLVDTTMHLSLVVVGVILGKNLFLSRLRDGLRFFPGILICLAAKMFLAPFIALIIVLGMRIEDPALQRSLVLTGAAPTGTFAAVLISFYGRPDERFFTAALVLLSSALSFITFPLLIPLTQKWFPY